MTTHAWIHWSGRVLAAALAVLVAAGLLVVDAPPAQAACTWTWDCSSGRCRQVQICDNAIDLPALRPLEVPPIPAPTIRPVDPLVVPPLGTTQCQQAYLCDQFGACEWQPVCR